MDRHNFIPAIRFLAVAVGGVRLKKKKKRKKSITSKLKEKLWEVFSPFVRVRDCLRTTGCSSWGLCITCDKRYHIKLLQAGHFIPGRHNANLFYERGCHAQCYYCNITLKGNTLAYMDALIKLYGEGIIDELRQNDKKIVKFTISELEDKIVYYEKQLRGLRDA